MVPNTRYGSSFSNIKLVHGPKNNYGGWTNTCPHKIWGKLLLSYAKMKKLLQKVCNLSCLDLMLYFVEKHWIMLTSKKHIVFLLSNFGDNKKASTK